MARELATRLSKKAATINAGVDPNVDPGAVPSPPAPDTVEPGPIDETAAIPGVMAQYRERVSVLAPEAKDELILRLAADYLGPNELEDELAAVEEEFVAEPEMELEPDDVGALGIPPVPDAAPDTTLGAPSGPVEIPDEFGRKRTAQAVSA